MNVLRATVWAGLVGSILTVADGRAAMAQVPELQVIVGPIEGPVALEHKSVGMVLQSLAARAGVIFVGQVETITSLSGVTEVVFDVQQGVSGEVGETYTLKEWSGRWTGGQQRYRIGQRAMVFLYAPNAAGISSPVDGAEGVVPLVPMGADSDPLLDVRWLATHVQRRVGEPIADADFGAVALADAVAVVRSADGDPLPEPVKRPLPVGLRPQPITQPVKMFGGDVAEDAQALPILQARGAGDVER